MREEKNKNKKIHQTVLFTHVSHAQNRTEYDIEVGRIIYYIMKIVHGQIYNTHAHTHPCYFCMYDEKTRAVLTGKKKLSK